MDPGQEDAWQFSRALFDEHFGPLTQAGLRLERLATAEEYWALHEATLSSHFPPEVFFRLAALRTAEQRDGQARLAALCGGTPLRDFTVIRQGSDVVGMFCGEQKTAAMYRMWHTVIHRDHRGQGLYRKILAGTIGYTAALGFDTITSEHAPCNNAIIIAKLKAGFHLYGFDLDATAGPSVVLRFFHNPEHLAAYQLRCGSATLTSDLAASGTGAWPQLREQVIASARPPEGPDPGTPLT